MTTTYELIDYITDHDSEVYVYDGPAQDVPTAHGQITVLNGRTVTDGQTVDHVHLHGVTFESGLTRDEARSLARALLLAAEGLQTV